MMGDVSERYFGSMHISTLFILGLLWGALSLPATAQKQNNIWYFGNDAGIDFNTSPPTVLSSSAIWTVEGCASVADPTTGALLFYTDGITIWNRNHRPMANGTDLHGGLSSTQSAMIVPDPGNPQRYYVFTAGSVEEGRYGIQYSIVDMSLFGGLGMVLAPKSSQILPPKTEKLTSVPHCNGHDIWVITQLSGTFSAFLLGDSGISKPVVSTPGVRGNIDPIGYLQASPDGRRLAAANYSRMVPLQLFDFDNTSGIVSNLLPLTTEQFFYGVCFSPDNSKLYATGLSKLFQYDLSSGNAAEIIASETVVYHSDEEMWAIQMGPDNRLYVARDSIPALGVVTLPNAPGTACGYIHNGIGLQNGISLLGLPNRVVQSGPTVTSSPILISTDTTICPGDSVQLRTFGGSSPQWSPADGLSCSDCPNPVARPASTITYVLSVVTDAGCTAKKSVTVAVSTRDPITVVASPDTTICIGQSADLSASGASDYLWEPETGLSCTDCPDPIATPTTTTIYRVTGSTPSRCPDAPPNTDSRYVTVVVNPYAVAEITGDTTICNGSYALLSASGGSDYRWEPSEGLSCSYCSSPVARPKQTTTYTVIVWSGDRCPDTASVTVSVRPEPRIDAEHNATICEGESTQLQATGGVAYSWSPTTGLSCSDCPDPVASPTSTTTYTVTGIDSIGCSASATVTVNVSSRNPIVAEISGDPVICRGDSTQLIASGGSSYSWRPASGLSCADCPFPVARPDSTTTYIVTVSGGACTNSDSTSITIRVLSSPAVQIRGDSILCRGESTQLIADGGTSYRWYPTAGLSCSDCPDPTASPATTTAYTVVATSDAGCVDSASLTVVVGAPPIVDAGPDQTTCGIAPVQLRASGAVAYIWSPSSGLGCSDCPDPIAMPESTTVYRVVGVDAFGCSAVDSVVVRVEPPVDVHAGRDTIICVGNPAILTATTTAGTVLWEPSTGIDCPTCPITEARPTSSTTYIVTATDTLGCSSSDTVSVLIDPGSISARALIGRNYGLHPTSQTVIPVELLDRLDDARIARLRISLSFDRRIVRLFGIELDSTLLKGWRIEEFTIDNNAGTMSATIAAPTGTFLSGNGTLMGLRIGGFLGEIDFSELPFTIDLPNAECTAVETFPGLVRIDSICGLNLRLIEISTASFALAPNRPNPFNPTTEISFSIGLDGPTRLEIYDAAGETVATLVDEVLAPGTYAVTWDAGDRPSGLYYYRLTSGTWSRTGVMSLVK